MCLEDAQVIGPLGSADRHGLHIDMCDGSPLRWKLAHPSPDETTVFHHQAWSETIAVKRSARNSFHSCQQNIIAIPIAPTELPSSRVFPSSPVLSAIAVHHLSPWHLSGLVSCARNANCPT